MKSTILFLLIISFSFGQLKTFNDHIDIEKDEELTLEYSMYDPTL